MSWADGEFEDAWFGDDRLRQRAIRVCERLAEHPSESIPVACCGRAEVEAAYRFFSNDKVTAARVLAPHHDASLRRLAAHPVVLCVQDTTELDFTGKQTTGLELHRDERSVSPCHHGADAPAAGSWRRHS
jgi:Transposase DNA-binding